MELGEEKKERGSPSNNGALGHKLTPRQEKFCAEYAVEPNGQQAAVRAGYAPHAARITASQILTRPNIQERLRQINAPRLRKLEITAERVLAQTAGIAFNETDARVRHFDQIEALKLLGKHLKLFTDKIDLTVDINIAEKIAQLRAARAAE